MNEQRRKLEAVMVFLSTIEVAFTVKTRGCVVVPVAFADPDLRVKAGDSVQLRGPTGCLEARIRSIEWLARHDNGCRFSLLLSEDIDCSQIPSDAEIWVMSE